MADDANPFADPSIMEAAETLDAGETVVGDYDPFGDAPSIDALDAGPPLAEFAPPAPAASTKKKKKRASATSGRQSDSFRADSDFTDESIRAREHEIARREARLAEQSAAHSAALTDNERRTREDELYRKEKELIERERLIAQAESLIKPKNWPKCWPLIYHDIKGEIIDPERVSIVRRLYFNWLFLFLTFFWNFITVLCASVSGKLKMAGENDDILSLLYSIVFMLVAIPLSFVLWYWRIYKYMGRGEVGSRYYVFFLFYGAQILFGIAMSIGVFGGAAGAGVMIKLLSCASGTCPSGTTVEPNDAAAMSLFGVFYAISMSMWIVNTLYGIWMFKVTYSYFKANFGKEAPGGIDDDAAHAAIIAASAARSI